jgi:hypothetical protein
MLASQAPRHGAIRSGIKLGIAALIVVALLPFASAIGSLLGAVPNPFASTHHERVQPPVLKSLQDLSEYHAATANLQAVVESGSSADYLPSFIKGEDTTYLAVGSVDAVVDFSQLGSSAIVLSPDGKSATFTLPEPTYAAPQLDLENSKVLSHSRGIFDRIGDVFTQNPDDQSTLMKLGNQALADAVGKTELATRAKTNTTSMLIALARQLGIENVTVVFTPPSVAR